MTNVLDCGCTVRAYNHKVNAYNHKVNVYNHKVNAYNHKVNAYNHKVNAYNHKVNASVSAMMCCHYDMQEEVSSTAHLKGKSERDSNPWG